MQNLSIEQDGTSGESLNNGNVCIRLPKNHPMVPHLMHLFRLIQTDIITQDGVEMKIASPPPKELTNEFLNVLRKVVGDSEAFDAAVAKLREET